MIEVRRGEDNELRGYVVGHEGDWRATTVFGGELRRCSGYDDAVRTVLDDGLSSLASHWLLSRPGDESEQVVCIQSRAFVTNKGAASVSVIDLDTGAVTSFAVGPNPHGLAVDTDYGRLYVTSIDADRLEVYDLVTLAPITTIPVGDGPWGVSVGPGRIAVTDTAADTVHLLDRDSLEVRDVVTVGAGPWNSAFLGGTLYVTLERTGEVVAVRGGRVAWRAPVGASPHGIVVDQQRDTVLAAVTGTNQVAVLDARRGAVLDRVDVAAGPAGMTIDPGTGRVFVGNQGAGVVTTLTPTR